MTVAASEIGSLIDVDPLDMPSIRDGVRVIDVRECSEFEGELGRVPGAASVPLAELLEWSKHRSKQEPLLVVCRAGRRSAAAGALLIRSGFERVFNLRGGMQAYHSAGLPVERGPCPC